MFDTDTKRRIDTARDILVGEVPDPKSRDMTCFGPKYDGYHTQKIGVVDPPSNC